jgi:hypothetical protein
MEVPARTSSQPSSTRQPPGSPPAGSTRQHPAAARPATRQHPNKHPARPAPPPPRQPTRPAPRSGHLSAPHPTGRRLVWQPWFRSCHHLADKIRSDCWVSRRYTTHDATQSDLLSTWPPPAPPNACLNLNLPFSACLAAEERMAIFGWGCRDSGWPPRPLECRGQEGVEPHHDDPTRPVRARRRCSAP